MKTAELTGAALDWAVAKCKGLDYFQPEIGPSQTEYSTDWAHGGPIIEREGLCLHRYKGTAQWSATYSAQDPEYFGPTPLIAAMRCYVASKLGDEISIPEDLTY